MTLVAWRAVIQLIGIAAIIQDWAQVIACAAISLWSVLEVATEQQTVAFPAADYSGSRTVAGAGNLSLLNTQNCPSAVPMSKGGGRLIPPLKVQRNEVIVNYR